MMDFALALFPPTAITGAGQFVHAGGPNTWLGWTQLAVLIGQVAVLAMLSAAITRQPTTVDVDDVLAEPDTRYLTVTAIGLLLLGVGLYMYGIWTTLPRTG